MQHRFIVFFFCLLNFTLLFFFLGTASVFFFNCSIAVIWGVVSLLRSEVMMYTVCSWYGIWGALTEPVRYDFLRTVVLLAWVHCRGLLLLSLAEDQNEGVQLFSRPFMRISFNFSEPEANDWSMYKIKTTKIDKIRSIFSSDKLLFLIFCLEYY